MTQEEEISHLNLQDFQADLEYKKGMEVGIRMGKKIMIDKVCQWLSLNMTDNVYMGCHGTSVLSKADLIQGLKKEMEE